MLHRLLSALLPFRSDSALRKEMHPVGTKRQRGPDQSLRVAEAMKRQAVLTSSNLEHQLLQDGLLEIIKANRFNADVAGAPHHMFTIVNVEAFGRLRRKNIFGRLYDNWQTVDNHAFRHQRVTNCM